MDNELHTIADELASGERSVQEISKEDAPQFFSIIRNREDFKQFHGIAKKGGSVVFRYLETPRS
ncbi:hypothetical protein LC040_06715 [Bacillus tianshenii]|nr:hypothetical protein LC040_06715 [Bacillus tianshenii]